MNYIILKHTVTLQIKRSYLYYINIDKYGETHKNRGTELKTYY